MADVALVRIALPAWQTPRNAWREGIHAAAAERLAAVGARYGIDDRLALHVCLYMNESMAAFHDIDNRLKDVLDALQGRAGGSKAVRRLAALIPNDNQVVRAVVEKVRPPAGDTSGGWFTVSVVSGESESAA